MRNRSIRRLVISGLAVGGLTMGVLAAPVFSGAATAKAGTTTLTVAEAPTSVPLSNFPFYTATNCLTVNIDYWNLQVRPGYWFGLGKSVALIPALSPLNLPTISASGANTTATFTTKGWKWSNGSGGTETMDAQDVAFFLNMDKAQENQGANAFCGYAPGFGIPDQVASVSYPHGLTGNAVTIVFDGHPSHLWLEYNELSQIVPLAKAWDTTGCSSIPFASVGNSNDATDNAGACQQSFSYLNGLQMNSSVWNWSDGPYRQKSAEYASGAPDGNDVQIVNASYSGPVKAHAVKTIVYKPYASTGAEVLDLQKNKLDLGYADPSNVTKSPGPGKAGKNLLPHMTNYTPIGSTLFGVFYYMFNFGDSHSTWPQACTGGNYVCLNNQQYFRAAIQESENQPFVITHVDNGYAIPTYSAIPTYPKNSNNKGVVNPYPYSATKGKALMKAHGWNVNVTPATCGTSNCGTAANPIPHGASATETVLVPTGDQAVKDQTNDEDSYILKAADIKINADFEDAGTVAGACFGGASAWQLCGYGGWIYAPDYYPSGEVLFAAGSSSNSGGYVSAEMNQLIHETTTSGNLALNAKDGTYHTSFAQWTATDVPFLWQPTPASFIEQAKGIKGSQPPNPLDDFNPEYITAI